MLVQNTPRNGELEKSAVTKLYVWGHSYKDIALLKISISFNLKIYMRLNVMIN